VNYVPFGEKCLSMAVKLFLKTAEEDTVIENHILQKILEASSPLFNLTIGLRHNSQHNLRNCWQGFKDKIIAESSRAPRNEVFVSVADNLEGSYHKTARSAARGFAHRQETASTPPNHVASASRHPRPLFIPQRVSSLTYLTTL